MALVLIATPGGATSNSYATAAEGDSYHEGRLFNTAWTGATTATKEAALVWATRLLDGMFVWTGWPASATQALLWPRVLQWSSTGLMGRNPYTVVPSTVVPQEIKNATAELARLLIAGDRTVDSDVEVQGITSIRAGSVAITFSGQGGTRVLPSSLYALIPSWWYTASSGRSGVRDLVRA